MATINTLPARLKTALSSLEDDWTAPIEGDVLKTIEEAELYLSEILVREPQTLQEVITLLLHVLANIKTNPSPITRLVSQLIEPLSFERLLSLEPPVDFVTGLDLSSRHVHLLVLNVLAKASSNSKNAATVAGMPAVVYGLVKLWLCTTDMGVADKALSVIVSLLQVDLEATEVAVHGVGNESSISAGQGLFWRRVFGDKDVYGLMYAIPSLNSNSDQTIGKNQKSIAQARLMSMILQLGKHDWAYILRSHHPDIEAAYGLASGEGLLHFAAIRMVDYKSDVLIHMNLIQFFAELLSSITKPSFENKDLSCSLQFLKEYGLHQRSMAYWLTADSPDHDPVDLNFLYGPSANYIATYATQYPEAFLSSEDASRVLIRLAKTLDISANQWAHGQSPKHELHVLSSIPPVALLPQRILGTGRHASPLLLVPCKVTNEDALVTLSKIFSCPPKPAQQTKHLPSTATSSSNPNSQASRALLHLYLQYHETFFADLTSHAATVALPERALAAIGVLHAIISAAYPLLPDQNTYPDAALPPHPAALPSEAQLRAHGPPFGPSQWYFSNGLSAIIETPARDPVLSWLLRPPQTFAHLVGARGDANNAAYRIAAAKWDVVQLMLARLRSADAAAAAAGRAAPALGIIRQAVEARVAESMFGARADAGGHVATLEL